MGKYRLSTLSPSIAVLQPAIGYVPNDPAARSRYRVQTEPWGKWYRTKKWQRIRLKVLTDQLWTCQQCKRIIVEKGQAHVDHVKPHRGNAEAFWKGELQVLCIECHAKKSVDEREMV
jgi:5-methylcytosine-specific restriction endonuclease McrA